MDIRRSLTIKGYTVTDIILDKNNDITFDGDDLAFFEIEKGAINPYLVAQRLEIKLRSLKGEWFRDINYGIPYIPNILSRNNQRDLADTYIRQVIKKDPDIKSIKTYTATFSKGVYSVYFEGTLKDGSSTGIGLEI